MALINPFGELALDSTVQKLVKIMFIGDVEITKTVDGNVTTFVKTGATNTTGIDTQTITIDKDTGITTKVWS